jgi:hypothetical protein
MPVTGHQIAARLLLGGITTVTKAVARNPEDGERVELAAGLTG